ncbi:MAG: Sua5/YciO/YrdC/YwlC family protein [Clostridia bacterium]|nr:Sua5/YciO/YrdC/YwlC family protein [Clostridia bacterium]
METKILPINAESLALAASIIKEGGVVAFPTETVYGLGGSATSDAAVREIYSVKGRPSDNPLIVHVHPDFDVNKLVKIEHGYAVDLAKKFLPGPLTMV